MKYINFKRYKFSTILKNINFKRYKFLKFPKYVDFRTINFSKIFRNTIINFTKILRKHTKHYKKFSLYISGFSIFLLLGYLNIPALMSAIELTGAEAVHPGYGFLSENSNFAKILEENNIKFVGPSSKLIKTSPFLLKR